MFAIRQVLFPVDFSHRCRGAARLIEGLHKSFQPEITLVHVLLPVQYELTMADLGGGMVREFSDARIQQAHHDLEYFLDDELRGFTVKRVLLEGDPARKLTEYAHKHQMDMIVMPTHGYGGFRRFVLGSVTAKVLHDADCPVLTGVHLEEVPEPEQIRIRKVAIAVDIGADSEESTTKVLCWAKQFTAACKAEPVLLHVVPSIEGMGGEYFEPNWRERFTEEAKERVGILRDKAELDAEILIEAGPVAMRVGDLVKKADADLLLIGRAHSAGVLGRVREHGYSIIRQSPCPVISV